jgi:hypothetical protein
MNAKRLAKQGRKEQQKEGQKAETRSCVSHHGRTVEVYELLSSRTLQGSCRPICTILLGNHHVVPPQYITSGRLVISKWYTPHGLTHRVARLSDGANPWPYQRSGLSVELL